MGNIYKWLSYFTDIMIEKRQSKISEFIFIKWRSGKIVVDAEEVNYAYGSLYKVFQESFKKLLFKQTIHPNNVLLLGFGAGSVYRLVRETFGEKVKIRGVELDPVMIQIYHDYFKKESDQIQIIQDDVLSYMHRQTETYDMILIDVFIGENIPETVFADSFVYAVEKALNLNGILLWNTIVDSEKQNIKFNHLINLLQAKDSWFVLNEINRMIYKRNTK